MKRLCVNSGLLSTLLLTVTGTSALAVQGAGAIQQKCSAVE
ncbi:MAG TPA: hypothetical protein VMX13_03420 [Sedimentisphaerales bacterium]|nr:hypothetical protein [Sedimentisphaerales bacterium]